jgi:hypothetical protein
MRVCKLAKSLSSSGLAPEPSYDHEGPSRAFVPMLVHTRTWYGSGIMFGASLASRMNECSLPFLSHHSSACMLAEVSMCRGGGNQMVCQVLPHLLEHARQVVQLPEEELYREAGGSSHGGDPSVVKYSVLQKVRH